MYISYMKVLTIIYKNNSRPVDVKLPDQLADQLYHDIFNARQEEKTTLRIEGNNVLRFIDPREIIDCMVIPEAT